MSDLGPSDNDETRSGALVGQRIAGRYRITRLLGRGGMGAVYEARTDEGLASRSR